MDTDESQGGAGDDDPVNPTVAEAVDAARRRDGPALVEVVTDPAEPQASEWMTRDR